MNRTYCTLTQGCGSQAEQRARALKLGLILGSAVRGMEPPGQPGDFARRRILAQGAFGSGLVEYFHGGSQGFSSGIFIGPGDSFQCAFAGSADPCLDRVVAQLAFEALTMAFFRRRMNRNMRHKPL